MAAIPYQEPTIEATGPINEPDTLAYPITAAQTYLRGAVLTLVSGALVKAATNVSTGVVGIAQHGAIDIYFTGIGGAAAVNDTSLFGSSTVGTALQSSEPLNGKVIAAHNNQPFVMSLVQAWAITLVGPAAAGVLLDATSGLFVADTSQSNKILNIIGKVDGAPGITGVVGDTGARIIVTFTSASLAV